MSYIDENLMPGEVVIYKTQFHWIIFLLPLLLWLLSLINILFAIAAIISSISSLITYISSEFGITNKRVIVKVGFIRRQSFETLLARIEGIGVDQSMLGRIFNYGTINIIGTGGSREPFTTIDAPIKFRNKVQEQIAALQNTTTNTNV